MSRLPKVVQTLLRLVLQLLPDRLVRRLPGRFVFVYKSDGLATVHYSPFLDDPEFDADYWSVASRWPGGPIDIRWRVWLFTECARQCTSLSGNFAEFGVYRGATAFMLLSRTELRQGQRLYLFDTFAGIPGSELTVDERSDGFEGRHVDTSPQEVISLLDRWRDSVSIVVGDVLTTLRSVETGSLAFAHLDLNAASPTAASLNYVYSRIVRGGIIVFDDYGWRAYDDQRRAIDHFFSDKDEVVVALPTGQAIVVKL